MRTKYLLLIATVVAVMAALWFLQKPTPMPGEEVPLPSDMPQSAQQKASKYPRAVELAGIATWINSEPFTLASLVGKKVVLFDFWTYSCINCQRTTPYLNQWHEKYHDKGLVIIGVHSPEFEFEKDEHNVRTAVKELGIKYPVAMDSDMATWSAWRNQYWPNKYLIDVDGYVVYNHIGEGGYEDTEKEIQKALAELMARRGVAGDVALPMNTPKDAPQVDFEKIKSPELYLGALRNGGMLGNARSEKEGSQTATFPQRIDTNKVYLDGTWSITPEYAKNTTSKARIRVRYNAKQVYIVAGAAQPVHITVIRDGVVIGKGITISNQTLYELINDASGYGEHTLEIIVDEPGLELFTFTFG